MKRIMEIARFRARCIELTLLATVTSACSESPAGPAALTIESTTPTAGAQSVGIDAIVQIEWSAEINAATVTASSVKVAAGGTPVVGTFAVAGSTITFTPTALLTEFNTTYTVTITTGVRATSGSRLTVDDVREFTTAFWDPAFYYRLTNLFQGPTLSLDTFGDTFSCYMGNSGNFTGQRWYFTPVAGSAGYYSMRNQFQGEALALEGAGAPDRCLLGEQPEPGVFFTGQMWQPVAVGTGHKLQNLNHGAAKSLDVIDDGNGTLVPMMVDTGPFSGQVWFFTRLFKR